MPLMQIFWMFLLDVTRDLIDTLIRSYPPSSLTINYVFLDVHLEKPFYKSLIGVIWLNILAKHDSLSSERYFLLA